jgi:hypothetical protein
MSARWQHILRLGGLILAMYFSMPAQVTTFGTAIAAIRVPSGVVIAADSRVVDGDGRRLPDECKIRIVSGIVYAAHGMSTHAPTGFDLFRLVSDDLRRPGGLDDLRSIAERLARSVIVPLTKALTNIRKTDRALFERATRTAAAGVILARDQAGAPQLASIRFLAQTRATDVVDIASAIHTCPSSDCPVGIAAVWVSPDDDRRAFERVHPEYWKEDLSKVAEAFVQGEIDKGLIDVGPPIDIVQITGGRIEWVQRTKGCVYGG